MDKSKLASIGERLKSTSNQMSRMVSQKVSQVKDFLQTPTPESRIIDQATSPSLESPDWGLNLRICSLINADELNGAEIVRSIKRKVVGGYNVPEDSKSQRLALELLEACAMNCEKVFSEIAAEKLVEEMVVKVVENPEADRECQVRAMELIRAWGESEDLSYLPVFRQTYENLRGRAMSSNIDDGSFPAMQHSLESYMDQHPVSPPESYPIPGTESDGASTVPYYGSLSLEQKKEFMEITRNSLEVLSSLLSSASEPKVVEDDLAISMLDKCKESQPVLQRIVQSTTDDEGLLFEALNLNDELQKVISKFEEMQVSTEPNTEQADKPKESGPDDAKSPVGASDPQEPVAVVSQSPGRLSEPQVAGAADVVQTPHDDTSVSKEAGADMAQSSPKAPKAEAVDVNKSHTDVVDLLSGVAESSERK